jgi:hypothetical protein
VRAPRDFGFVFAAPAGLRAAAFRLPLPAATVAVSVPAIAVRLLAWLRMHRAPAVAQKTGTSSGVLMRARMAFPAPA